LARAPDARSSVTITSLHSAIPWAARSASMACSSSRKLARSAPAPTRAPELVGAATSLHNRPIFSPSYSNIGKVASLYPSSFSSQTRGPNLICLARLEQVCGARVVIPSSRGRNRILTRCAATSPSFSAWHATASSILPNWRRVRVQSDQISRRQICRGISARQQAP